ncbi:hypothetical protein TNCV_1671081 [Trichonephila clavipes]|nr:hypothetical protein TNCV_1671081 [Trichonephila clavipes]
MPGGRQIAALLHPPSFVTELKRALQEAWNRLSPQLIHHLKASMNQNEQDPQHYIIPVLDFHHNIYHQNRTNAVSLCLLVLANVMRFASTNSVSNSTS